MRIEILESACDDLPLRCLFYERQRSRLGNHFLDTLCSDIESFLLTASAHAVYFERYHRMLSKRFPFAVYYRVEGEAIR